MAPVIKTDRGMDVLRNQKNIVREDAKIVMWTAFYCA